jgi:putative membrane protein
VAVEIYLASIIPLAAALQNFEIVTPSLLGLNARVPLSLLVAIAYLLGAATGAACSRRCADHMRVQSAG